MDELPAEDQIVLSTVRLTVPLPTARQRIGTGFFVKWESAWGGVHSYIVTNKHVLERGLRAHFHVVTRDGPDGPVSQTEEGFTLDGLDEQRRVGGLVDHPDPEIDLSALFVNACVNSLAERRLLLLNRHLPANWIISANDEERITAIESVLVVGYPDGLWDDVNNRPIVRRGLTATPATVDFRGRREFLIDAACFEGMSGSPVFLIEEGTFNLADDQPLYQRRYRLLGVLTESPPGKIERAVLTGVHPTTDAGAVSEYEIPLHLGTVIKASRVRELCEAMDHRIQQARKSVT